MGYFGELIGWGPSQKFGEPAYQEAAPENLSASKSLEGILYGAYALYGLPPSDSQPWNDISPKILYPN